MGTDPMNICNRGKSKQGVQLEVSRKARDLLRYDNDRLNLFSEAVREGIEYNLDCEQDERGSSLRCRKGKRQI